jgi:DNA-binding NarL/FixJ family response regulator
MAVSVLLADDQELVRAGFRLILDDEEDIRGGAEAADGQQALELARLHRPDVVLMDIEMPVLDGIEATRRLNAVADPPKVVILTTFERDDYIASALRAGASGFLVKSAAPANLIAGIRTVADGDAILSPSVTRRVIEQFAGHRTVEPSSELYARLTEREREVLVLVAHGLNNKEIADRFVVSEGTVKTHVSRTLAKLGVRDRVQAVIFAYDHGLIRPGEGARRDFPPA